MAKLIELHQKEKKKFHDSDILSWAKQIASGLNYLHSVRIEHNDIKPK